MGQPVAYQGWTREELDATVEGLPIPRVHTRRDIKNATGPITLNEDRVVIDGTTGVFEMSDLVGEWDRINPVIWLDIKLSDVAHQPVWQPHLVCTGPDPRSLGLRVGVVEQFILVKNPDQSEVYLTWLNAPPIPHTDRHAIAGDVTDGALTFQWQNPFSVNARLTDVSVRCAAGTFTLEGSVVGADPIWTTGAYKPTVTVDGGSDSTQDFDDGIIAPGDWVQWVVANGSTTPQLNSIQISVSYVMAEYGARANGTSTTPPAAPSTAIVYATGGDFDADGNMSLGTATLTALDGATVGDASAIGSNDLFVALSNYVDPTIVALRGWINHPNPASLSVWTTGAVAETFDSYIGQDSRIPWTVVQRGPAPDYVTAWSVTTDPTGHNDPAFESDDTHDLTVQILRDDPNDCEIVTVTFTISTTRGAPTVPGIPSGLAATPAVNGANVTWSSVVGAASYELRVTPSGGSAVVQPATGTSKSLTGLTAGTSHEIVIRSVGADGARSAWSPAVNVTPTGSGGGFGEGLLTGVTSQAIRRRSTSQGSAAWTSKFHLPATIYMANASKTGPMSNDKMLSGLQASVNRWNNGRGTDTSDFTGPMRMLTLYLTNAYSGFVNAKYVNNNHVTTFTECSKVANGADDAQWASAVQALARSTVGNVAPGYWCANTIVRLGWEVGGNWNLDFPGVDPALKIVANGGRGDLGPAPSNLEPEVRDAWNECRNTGDRFPMWKLAWDRITKLCDRECDRLGVPRIPFCCNLADAAAEPDMSLNTSGPPSQWSPQCVTDVERKPDTIGWDYYLRAAPQPPLLSGQPADGDPVHYDWTRFHDDNDKVRDLCLLANRPLSIPEYGACRVRKASVSGGQGWADDRRAAGTRYMNEWLDTGCGGAGVPIYMISIFVQKDALSGVSATEDKYYQKQTANNQSFTWLVDQHPEGITMPSAAKTRAAWEEWISPAIIPS